MLQSCFAELFRFQISALRETSLVQEMEEAGAPGMGYYYMGQSFLVLLHLLCSLGFSGFYIFSCQKMRYKGEYSPSYLADPVRIQNTPLLCICDANVRHRKPTHGTHWNHVYLLWKPIDMRASPIRRAHTQTTKIQNNQQQACDSQFHQRILLNLMTSKSQLKREMVK